MPRKHRLLRGWPTLRLSLALSLLAASAFAQSPAAQRGLTFVRTHCAQCHAIDKASESPRAASGHVAAAPPSSAMNSRRLTSSIGSPSRLAPPGSLPHAQPAAEGPASPWGRPELF
jgi:mono/diheme cytochrome c family protein